MSAESEAQETLNTHLREIISWHFSPDTGCPFWLDWASRQDWDPREKIKTFADINRFPHFQDEWLRDEKNERFVPRGYGEFGRVELTTLTKEFFMPRFLERNEAIRRKPHTPYAWDGVGDVRPFGALENKVIEGVS